MDYKFKMKNIMQASLLSGIKLEELTKCLPRMALTERALRTSECIYTVNYSHIAFYVVNDGTLWKKATTTLREDEEIAVIVFNYLATQKNFVKNSGKFKQIMTDYYTQLANISSHYMNIEIAVSNIRSQMEKFNSNRFQINTEDVVETFTKVCKKLKISYSFVSGLHNLKFKDVKVGNEIEGYINYKSITFVVDDDFKLRDMIFGFNGFVVRSSWHLSYLGTLHPHINADPRICFGNRDVDFKTYSTTGNVQFFCLLLKETVSNYSPENPFIKINDIRNKIKGLEHLSQIKNVTKDGKIYEFHTHPEEYSKYVLEGRKACPHCSGFLYPSPIDAQASMNCTNPECAANPNAELICSECSTPLTRGVWQIHERKYKYECYNANCSCSVQVREKIQRYKRIFEAIKQKALTSINQSKTTFTYRAGTYNDVVFLNNKLVLSPLDGLPLRWYNNNMASSDISAYMKYLVIPEYSDPIKFDFYDSLKVEDITDEFMAQHDWFFKWSMEYSAMNKFLERMYNKEILFPDLKCPNCGAIHGKRSNRTIQMSTEGNILCNTCGATLHSFSVFYEKLKTTDLLNEDMKSYITAFCRERNIRI